VSLLCANEFLKHARPALRPPRSFCLAESIQKAADFIEVLDANKPILRVVARTTGTLLIVSIIYGIIAKNAGPDADLGQLIFDRYFAMYLPPQ